MTNTTNTSAVPRTYQQLWNDIKQYKQGAIIPTISKERSTFEKFVSTIRRAVQKEKYLDTRFRVKFPNAKLTSKVLYDERKLVFELDLGIPLDIQDF
jgi:hypothetical protein